MHHWILNSWILNWLLSGLGLIIVAQILPGIQVDGFLTALIAAFVIGLVNATVGLVLNILTLGILAFLINGLMLKLASEFVPGFRVNGCLTAVVGSFLLTVIDYLLTRLI